MESGSEWQKQSPRWELEKNKIKSKRKKVRGSGNFSLSATGQVGLHQGTLWWVWQMLDEANGFDFASSHTRNLTGVCCFLFLFEP